MFFIEAAIQVLFILLIMALITAGVILMAHKLPSHSLTGNRNTLKDHVLVFGYWVFLFAVAGASVIWWREFTYYQQNEQQALSVQE